MKERIIQFGEGGFLRGFADWMIHKMNEKLGLDFGVVVVQNTRRGSDAGVCRALNQQGCKFTHIMRGEKGVEQTLVESISRCVDPYTDLESFLSLAEGKDMRFIISNTTEAGIVFDPSDRRKSAPDVSFPAKLTLLLKRRFDKGLDGFIILPCELIEENGSAIKSAVLSYAKLWGYSDEFISFVKERNIFCNTLVDRINTGFPVGEELHLPFDDKFVNTSEFYHLWVIETEHDLERELPLSRAGLNVIITKNELSKYRTRKVRILNGAHTSLVPHALLSGYDTVKSCVDSCEMREYIRKCVFDEIIPTLDLPHGELCDYAESVIERFSNPYIKHYLSSIALNSVSKFKVRVLPSILEYKRRFGSYPPTLVFAFARLLSFYKTDMANDSPDVTEYMRSKPTEEILANKALWGEDLSDMLCEVLKYEDK